ncbi:MAG: dephospho-CoA kinase [Chitinispirillaceae bacterium]|nr:dephospho-CoA kinase [Chitinispirillaceae bacterium]
MNGCRRTHRLCIAGYMGAGKSTAADMCAAGKATVINADREAKTFIAGNEPIRKQLEDAFGAGIVEEKALCFKALGRMAFSGRDHLLRLNAIVHPPFLLHLGKRIDACGDTVCILDAALAPLWRIEAWFDRNIWIEAPWRLRFERLRRSLPELSDKDIMQRMRLQEEVLAIPTSGTWTLISNDGTLAQLRARCRSAAEAASI